MKRRVEDDELDCWMLPEVKVINNLEGLAVYRGEWNQILSENQNTNPFLEFDWVENWWKHLGSGHRLFVLVLRRENRIVGFGPFMIIKRKLYKEITFIGYLEASIMDFILTKEERALCIEAVMEYIRNLHCCYILHLHGLYEHSDALTMLGDYCYKKQNKFFIRSFEAPYIRMNSDFTTYFKGRSKHNSIKTLNRSKNKLEDAGNITYKYLNNKEFDDGFQLHEARWKRKYDSSNFTRKKYREFFQLIANNPNVSFRVSAYGMKLGERLIAFTYGFLCNGTYYLYRICHDDDFSVFGPGKILLMKLIEDCFQKEIQFFDFGLGYARYKYEWTDDKNILYEFIAPLASPYSRMLYYRFLFRKSVIEMAKKFKFYDTLKLGFLGMLQCFISGIYFRDMHHKLQRIKKELGNHRLRDNLKKIAKHLYQSEEYMIVELNIITNIMEDDIVDDKAENIHGVIADNTTDNTEKDMSVYAIYEMQLNDLELLSEISKEQPVQIIKRFYQKQRCFMLDDDIKQKDYLWVNYNHIEVADIKYQDILPGNTIYFDLTKVDADENAIKRIRIAIKKIIKILKAEKGTKYYMGFHIKKVI